jgi:hypothetical protein
MLSVILAVVAAAWFMFMLVAILIALRLSDKLYRAEQELKRQQRIPVKRWVNRTDTPPSFVARQMKTREGGVYRIEKRPTREGGWGVLRVV